MAGFSFRFGRRSFLWIGLFYVAILGILGRIFSFLGLRNVFFNMVIWWHVNVIWRMDVYGLSGAALMSIVFSGKHKILNLII